MCGARSCRWPSALRPRSRASSPLSPSALAAHPRHLDCRCRALECGQVFIAWGCSGRSRSAPCLWWCCATRPRVPVSQYAAVRGRRAFGQGARGPNAALPLAALRPKLPLQRLCTALLNDVGAGRGSQGQHGRLGGSPITRKGFQGLPTGASWISTWGFRACQHSSPRICHLLPTCRLSVGRVTT